MFYELFEQLCKQKGVTPNRACLEMGISRSTAAKWKNTGGKAGADTLFKISAYFGVPVSYFNDDAENEKSPAPDGAELSELEKDILDRMSQLTPEDRVRVDAYIQGLLAAREG